MQNFNFQISMIFSVDLPSKVISLCFIFKIRVKYIYTIQNVFGFQRRVWENGTPILTSLLFVDFRKYCFKFSIRFSEKQV